MAANIHQLTNRHIPLQERYDAFVLWINEKTNNVSELLASELSIEVSVIDVFFELGNLDPEEFDLIDVSGLDIDELFIVVRARKDIRLRIYNRSKTFLTQTQPLKAIRDFIDDETFVKQEEFLRKVSSDGWKCIAKYLKSRNIDNGAISKRFRGLLGTLAKFRIQGREFSPDQMSWLIGGILHDLQMELHVFTCDDLKTTYREDFNLISKAIDLIKLQLSE